MKSTDDPLDSQVTAENNTSSDTYCVTVGDVKTTTIVFSAFGITAALFYITAIALIIRSRVYRDFVHRLNLYLAIGGLLRAVTLWLTVIPLDIQLPDNYNASLREGWYGMCVFSGFLTQYAVFFQTFTVVWIGVYAFVAVVFQKQLQHLKHEIAGVVMVLVGPLVFTWEPFITNSYGVSGSRCWIAEPPCGNYDPIAILYELVVHIIPHLLLTVVGLVLLLSAVLSLARKVLFKPLRAQYWRAIKGILPLMLYPFFYSLIYLASVLALSFRKDARFLNVTGIEAFVSLIQLCSGLILVSLLLVPRVRQNLCVRVKREENEPLTSISSQAAAV